MMKDTIELINSTEGARADNKAVEIYGFVDNIPELMDESDAIITKPGGLTSSEAIMKNIPIIPPASSAFEDLLAMELGKVMS